MTDRASPDEIKDVLTSIRRLMEDGETPSRAKASDDAPARLLLTRDLRVSQNDEGIAAEEEHELAAKVARLRRAIASRPDLPQGNLSADGDGEADHEPARNDGIETAPSAPVEDDPAGGSYVAEPASETLPVAAPDLIQLRAAIREIVRQELQGALGERVTGNVRKLVHREVRDALAMRDLD